MKIFPYHWLRFLLLLALTGCSGNQSSAPEPEINQAQTEAPVQEAENSVQPEHTFSPSQPAPSPRQDKVLLDVPLIKQNPELKYGCEVTSLTMVLNHAGIKTDKLKLADELPKDDDPVHQTKSGDITHWGNPDHGFVGDVTGKRAGYAIYAEPLEKLMNRYLPNRTVNLTKKPFDELLAQLNNGKPVIVWTTGDFKAPDRWESWKHGNEEIRTPLDLHVVVLVGYDPDYVYVNDPLSGKKARKVRKASFLESWTDLGQQALSYN